MDALIGTPSVIDLAVTVFDREQKRQNSDSQGFCSEVKQDFICADKPRQRLSETIVFSFLQKRMNPSANSLIPTIGISDTELVV